MVRPPWHEARLGLGAKKGADLRIPAPGQSKKIAMFGLLDWAPRDLIVQTSRTKRSSDFIALLEEVDRRFGPKFGVALKPIVLVLDNGPIHTSKASRAALAERAHWLRVEWLPKYASELNASGSNPFDGQLLTGLGVL